MELPADSPLLRIGELSRRLGVSDHVLRGWANRYGLLQLQRNGWRIGYLGAGTPVEELEGLSTARILAWSSWPLPVRRPSSRSARSSAHWPGAPGSPSPGPAPRRRSRLRREPG